jgi:Arc/MetJ family transcription regulator
MNFYSGVYTRSSFFVDRTMPSDKSQRKQVVVDRDLLAQVRKCGRKFRLSDHRDAAVVDAALRDWVSTQSRSAGQRPTGVRLLKTDDAGHEHRLKVLIEALRSMQQADGTVGPVGYKACKNPLIAKRR